MFLSPLSDSTMLCPWLCCRKYWRRALAVYIPLLAFMLIFAPVFTWFMVTHTKQPGPSMDGRCKCCGNSLIEITSSLIYIHCKLTTIYMCLNVN